MKHILKFLKEYRKEAVLAPLFKLLEAVFELFVPLVMAGIIDKGIPNKDFAYVGKMGGMLILLAIIGLSVAVTAQYFAAKTAVGVSTKLRQAVFDHIQSLDFTNVDKVGTSTLITRMTSDINSVQSGINMTLRLFLRSPIVVFGAMIMAFTIDVKSALVFVLAIPLLAIVVIGITVITMPMYKKSQAGLDSVLSHTRENLTGVRVIRAFHIEDRETAEYEKRNNLLMNMQLAVGRISAVMNPVTYIIVNAAACVLIYTGAIQVNVGNLTQGEVVAILNYMSQILVELIKLANLIVTMTKAFASAQRVGDVLDIQNESVFVSEKTTSSECQIQERNYIEFRNVGLTYAGAGAETLNNISFSVKKGDTVGIIGGTGSGKSSLVNMIPGFYKASQGEILIGGTNINDIPEKNLRDKIGMVPQKAVLVAGTIRSNLCWGKADATDEELWEAIRLAQATEVVEGKEGKLDAVVEQNGRNFSGGQRQRLTIARALVKRPEILILDDSSSALDYATDARLRSALKSLDGTCTTFIVSQRTASIKNADMIVVLDDGQLVGLGTHEELLKTCEVYQEISKSQGE